MAVSSLPSGSGSSGNLSGRENSQGEHARDLGLLDGLATTRAIRRFLPDPIPEPDLAKILWSATRAPSASNLQPLRFVVLRDGPRSASARLALREGFRYSWDEMRSRTGYDKVPAGSRAARVSAAMDAFVDQIATAPVIVLAVAKPGRRCHWIVTDGSSIYPALQNLLVSARALGYGGVMSMWHQPVADELHEILSIPPEFSILATVPIGRPQGRHGPVRRLPLHEVVFEDTWAQAADWAVDPPGSRFTRVSDFVPGTAT
jgi:nitroreductase